MYRNLGASGLTPALHIGLGDYTSVPVRRGAAWTFSSKSDVDVKSDGSVVSWGRLLEHLATKRQLALVKKEAAWPNAVNHDGSVVTWGPSPGEVTSTGEEPSLAAFTDFTGETDNKITNAIGDILKNAFLGTGFLPRRFFYPLGGVYPELALGARVCGREEFSLGWTGCGSNAERIPDPIHPHWVAATLAISPSRGGYLLRRYRWVGSPETSRASTFPSLDSEYSARGTSKGIFTMKSPVPGPQPAGSANIRPERSEVFVWCVGKLGKLGGITMVSPARGNQ